MPLTAHQPVMDMAPRWEEGYGFQVRQEHFGSNELLKGSNKVNNPDNKKRYVYTTWFEGVYTFKKEIRVTFKVPYLYQTRTRPEAINHPKQKNQGLGDIVFGLPLKKYTNFESSTQNISLTPSIRIPTAATSGDYALGDGSWDFGLSLSYSHENPKFYQLYDVFVWKNTAGKRNMKTGDELGLDINLGYHAYHDENKEQGLFIMLDIRARHYQKPNLQARTLTNATGGQSLYSGPIVVLYQENIMMRAEYRWPIYEKVDGIANSRGNELNIGIGITF